MRPSSSLGNIRLLGLFNFFNDFRLFGPVMIIYFADVSGSFTLGGSVLAITMISSALLEVPCGLISDRLPRTRIATYGAIATTLAIAMYAIAPGYEVLVVGAVLEGLGRSLFSGNNDALLWESLAENDRLSEFHHHSGRVSAAFQLGLAISAISGGVIAGWSMRWAVILSIIPQVCCVFVALLMREPKVHSDIEPARPLKQLVNAARNIIKHKELRRITLARAISHGAGESGWQFQPSFVALLWPTWAIGVGRGINHVLAMASFWFAGRVIDRFGATKALLGGSLFTAALGFVAYGKPNVASPALLTFEGADFGISSTSKLLLLQQRFSDRERATMGSIGQLLGSMLFGIFSITAGVIADVHGPQAALLTCHVAVVSVLPVYWRLHRSVTGKSR